MRNTITRLSALGLAGLMLSLQSADTCTRFVYLGLEDRVLTARSMDWKEDMFTNLWAFPRGMERDGATGPNTVRWTSRFGSVIASAYEFASTDGLNDQGLVANLLWQADAQYPEWDGESRALAVSVWPQYMLDNFATVEEAVAAMREKDFVIITDTLPGTERMATVHLSISDRTGDSAIFEFEDGELQIFHSRDYQVMTNEPPFPQQRALTAYWQTIGGTTMLPGTNRAADRFVRASFYVNAVPRVAGAPEAAAIAFSVIRNASVPLGITTPDQPNISSTIWRTVSDQKDLIYYFESPFSPSVFYVRLSDLDLSEGAPAQRLALGPRTGRVIFGAAAELFEPAEPFQFQGPAE